MAIVSVDFETWNEDDLKAGIHAYVKRLRILMMAWHVMGDPAPVELWTPGQQFPSVIRDVLRNGGRLSGWNAVQFERLVWHYRAVPDHGFPEVDDDVWIDSMHLAAAANLPRSLDGCAKAVGAEVQKDSTARTLMLRVTNGKRTPWPPKEADLQRLGAYCIQDVAAEEATASRLPAWPDMKPWASMPAIDRRINDRGVLIDVPLVQGLARAAAIETARLDADMAELTAGKVPATTSIEALKQWLLGRGVELPLKAKKKKNGYDEQEEEMEDEDEPTVERGSPWQLRKNDIADLLARTDIAEDCRLALAIRAEAAKASAKKLRTMLVSMTDAGRLCGSLILGGAQQTLRWSGARWQPHNLVRDVFANPDEIAETNGLSLKTDRAAVHRLAEMALDTAIEAGRTGDTDMLRMLYETPRKDAQGRSQVAGVLVWISRMLRRTITAPYGALLLNGDFAQVEARVTVWLTQQLDMLHAFTTGDDVYKIAAAGIYHIPAEQMTKQIRQTGKVSTLALGFGGGPGALLAMGYNYGLMLSSAEAVPIVQAWRTANSQTVAYWYATDDAAAMAVMNPGREFFVPPLGLVSYFTYGDCLCCRLPSGRLLRYWKPRLQQEYWDDGKPKQRLSLSGLSIKGSAVFRRSLYHTILVENQVQAIAADLLGCALENMEEAVLPVVLHVHDSVAAEVPEDKAEDLLPVFRQAMLAMPDWTKGLPIAADCDASARFG